MSRSILADAFDHHVWATLKVIDACLALGDEQLATTVPGTYGSILDTMRHLVGADASYLELLSGGRVEGIDEGSMSLAELRPVMEANGPIWSDVVEAAGDPDRVILRTRDDGSTSSAPLGIRLAQVVHHGTDHRSQVCTALTNLGIEPPDIDLWVYGRLVGRSGETEPAAT